MGSTVTVDGGCMSIAPDRRLGCQIARHVARAVCAASSGGTRSVCRRVWSCARSRRQGWPVPGRSGQVPARSARDLARLLLLKAGFEAVAQAG